MISLRTRRRRSIKRRNCVDQPPASLARAGRAAGQPPLWAATLMSVWPSNRLSNRDDVRAFPGLLLLPRPREYPVFGRPRPPRTSCSGREERKSGFCRAGPGFEAELLVRWPSLRAMREQSLRVGKTRFRPRKPARDSQTHSWVRTRRSVPELQLLLLHSPPMHHPTNSAISSDCRIPSSKIHAVIASRRRWVGLTACKSSLLGNTTLRPPIGAMSRTSSAVSPVSSAVAAPTKHRSDPPSCTGSQRQPAPAPAAPSWSSNTSGTLR